MQLPDLNSDEAKPQDQHNNGYAAVDALVSKELREPPLAIGIQLLQAESTIPRTGSPPVDIKARSGRGSRNELHRSVSASDLMDGGPMGEMPQVPGLEEMLLRASPKFTEPFSLAHVTRNESIGKAARRELDGSLGGVSDASSSSRPQVDIAGSLGSLGLGSSGGVGSGMGLAGMGSYAAEIERQQAALTSLDQDVADECKMNREAFALMLEMMERSRRCLEGIARLLQALGAAEAAYAAAMGAAASIRLALDGEADAEMRHAAEDLMALPAAIAQAHKPLHSCLTSLAADVTELHAHYRATLREVATQSVAAHRSIDAAARALRGAFDEHVTACCSFDGVLAQRVKGRPARAPDIDPWATEAKLVREHKCLQRCQDQERTLLKRAVDQATELEGRRIELVTKVMTASVGSYRAALLPMQHDLKAMTSSLAAHHPTEDKLGGLRNMAHSACRTAETLAVRQAECVDSVSRELFCSPEIVRQGELQLWEPAGSRWKRCHFVLTRAGYLHWFAPQGGPDDSGPLGGLALCRCSFAEGNSPRFNLVESVKGAGWLGAMRTRRVEFQAASVEESCDWVDSIREAMNVACGRNVMHEDS